MLARSFSDPKKLFRGVNVNVTCHGPSLAREATSSPAHGPQHVEAQKNGFAPKLTLLKLWIILVKPIYPRLWWATRSLICRPLAASRRYRLPTTPVLFWTGDSRRGLLVIISFWFVVVPKFLARESDERKKGVLCLNYKVTLVVCEVGSNVDLRVR